MPRRNKFMRAVSSPLVWAKAVLAAGISAGAGGVLMVLKDPQTFNFQAGLTNLLTVAGACALVGVAGFLKDSPIPE